MSVYDASDRMHGYVVVSVEVVAGTQKLPKTYEIQCLLVEKDLPSVDHLLAKWEVGFGMYRSPNPK